ncbi:hypothetical protein [Labrys wisconsinensis]|uniref:Uncharacterized protein n=1 Tax=Labrys wisconsinensis TaxID=425677 RepID=A0ABU0JKM8_9HYPH|nr:hypothetical protein [Labrys wisconsinensis]MDQ0474850.1 hypothetical protein [Labrys wisconsinensis]
MADPTFHQLNRGWNAEPSAPEPNVKVVGRQVHLSFFLNPWAYEAREGEAAELIFFNCTRWRLGSTNDEGWYLGQCRYSHLAPTWGEFYEIAGDDAVRLQPTDWRLVSSQTEARRHFLFYLKDQTFECLAESWMFSRRDV